MAMSAKTVRSSRRVKPDSAPAPRSEEEDREREGERERERGRELLPRNDVIALTVLVDAIGAQRPELEPVVRDPCARRRVLAGLDLEDLASLGLVPELLSVVATRDVDERVPPEIDVLEERGCAAGPVHVLLDRLPVGSLELIRIDVLPAVLLEVHGERAALLLREEASEEALVPLVDA